MITSAALEALLYDLPLLVAASRGRRRINMRTAAAQAGVATMTIQRVEQGKGCEARTLIRLLAWLEQE